MNLTISSPLEAHKSHTLCFSLCGVDVGFDNPTFAALEVMLNKQLEAVVFSPLAFYACVSFLFNFQGTVFFSILTVAISWPASLVS